MKQKTLINAGSMVLLETVISLDLFILTTLYFRS